MNLHDAPDEAEYRARVREWLSTAVADLPQPEPELLHERLPYWRSWQRRLYDAGYAGITWPVEHGGQGLDERLRAVFREETDRAAAPRRLNIIGEDLAGPIIIRFGTERQRSQLLRPILTGEEIWCQLFSEPESGSDLASLRTTATKVEGGWRIQGQKIWTSGAQHAARAILLARTGGGERHKGITCFLLPMDSAGVTVRPLAHLLGESEFSEVFLDEVFVPDDAVVGEVDGGWAVAMATLAFERVAIATGRVNTVQAIEEIIADIRTMRTSTGDPLGAEPIVRQKVADLWSRALVHRLIGHRVVTDAASDAPPGPVSSVGKLYFGPLVSDLADFRLSLEPLADQFELGDSRHRAERWLRLANQSRGTAIAGGSTFIQRNIIAERVLGMPRS